MDASPQFRRSSDHFPCDVNAVKWSRSILNISTDSKDSSNKEPQETRKEKALPAAAAPSEPSQSGTLDILDKEWGCLSSLSFFFSFSLSWGTSLPFFFSFFTLELLKMSISVPEFRPPLFSTTRSNPNPLLNPRRPNRPQRKEPMLAKTRP